MRTLLLVMALAGVAPSFAQSHEPPVRIRTEGLPAHVAASLQEKARLGMTELVQYVNRTRMMGHQVNLAELLADDPPPRRMRRVPRTA